MPDPTKVATKAADTVFSSADFCNILRLAASCSAVLLVNIVRDDRRRLYLPPRRVKEKTRQSRAVTAALGNPSSRCAVGVWPFTPLEPTHVGCYGPMRTCRQWLLRRWRLSMSEPPCSIRREPDRFFSFPFARGPGRKYEPTHVGCYGSMRDLPPMASSALAPVDVQAPFTIRRESRSAAGSEGPRRFGRCARVAPEFDVSTAVWRRAKAPSSLRSAGASPKPGGSLKRQRGARLSGLGRRNDSIKPRGGGAHRRIVDCDRAAGVLGGNSGQLQP